MTYHYTMCGLDYVYLDNGYRKEETEYGSGVAILHADTLDTVIAMLIIRYPARLRGQEVRFLRAITQISQTELANQLGVKRITVARWESSPNTPIPGPADRVIRLLTVRHIAHDTEHGLTMIVDMMSEIADERPSKLIMTYRGEETRREPTLFPQSEQKGDGWRLAKAA